MKKLTLLFVFLMGAFLQTSAQNRIVERSFAIEKDDQVRLDLQFGELISVKSWDKDEVAFKAVIEINGGKLNDALVLDFDQKNSGLEISTDYYNEKLKGGRSEDCPKSNYSRYSWNNDDDGSYVVCSQIRYEVFVPRNADLDIESISGDIELAGLNGSIRAKSISGFVDLSWSEGNPADIDIKTVSGEAYTNLDNLQLNNKKDHMPLVGYELRGRIGQNGPRVSLESVSGDIYLRKGNS